MNTRSILAIASILLGLTATASAQVGVYAEISGAGVGQTSGTSSSLYFGPTFGAQYEKGHLLRLGGDFRGTILSSNGTTTRSVVFGPRVSVHPPVLPVKPYGEFLIGAGGIKASTTSTYDNHVDYEYVLGLDSTILPHIDWRVIEYVHASYINNASNDRNQISTGIVVRFF
jgi:hypothetical protein